MSNCIIYPGTFDPITNGHVDLIERAGRMFNKVVIAIAENSRKQPLFTLEERRVMVEEVLSKHRYVEVCTFSGLLIEFARTKNIMMVLRGLRAISDFEHELQLSNINRVMEPEIETVFLASAEKHAYISSSVVREIALLGGDVSPFVSTTVNTALRSKYSSRLL